MKKIASLFFLLSIFFSILAVPSWSGTIKEADFPTRYEVVNAAQSGKLVIDKSCSMTLRDQAKANVIINVWRKAYGSCTAFDNGKIYRGRRNDKKNAIELIIPVSDTKARVEDWHIVGTVDHDSGK